MCTVLSEVEESAELGVAGKPCPHALFVEDVRTNGRLPFANEVVDGTKTEEVSGVPREGMRRPGKIADRLHCPFDCTIPTELVTQVNEVLP